MDDLSNGDARRITLRAQGFGRRPARAGRAAVQGVVDRVVATQIDPISVLVRAQYLPAFSRVGPYDRGVLDRMVEHGQLFEYMAHAACLLPIELFPLVRYRMDSSARNPRWKELASPARVAGVLSRAADLGPSTATELSDTERVRREGDGPWGRKGVWSDDPGRRMVQWLWLSGRLVTVGRRGAEQLYDLPERAVPLHLQDPVPADEARRELLVLAAGALGVGTALDLRQYVGMGGHSDRYADPGAKPATLLAELVEDGRLEPCTVEGWEKPAFRDPAASSRALPPLRALLGPFDSLLWHREHVARLFGFQFKSEIYFPADQRVYGYYLLPFLLGDELVGRVDLKADRARRTLLVQSAHAEPGVDLGAVVDALTAELADLARWLVLDTVEIVGPGDLSPALA